MEESYKEIDKTLTLTKFCMRRIGLSFKAPESSTAYVLQKMMFIMTISSMCYHVFGDIVYICLTLSNSPRVEDVVPLFHTFGYGVMSK